MSPGALIFNSPFINTDIYRELYLHLSLDVITCMTHFQGISTRPQSKQTTQRQERVRVLN
uniref:Uncharacterized protein n=1 Tax=Mesocestoides corti TaxID=53468 RepID=A0A5K3FQF8_MESCO